MDGTTDKRATAVVKTMLGMPSIQAALDEKFNAAGLTVDHCANVMKAITDADEGDAALMAVKLKAIDMRVKMTVGYAPTRTDNVNMNVAGRAFDAQAWENVPAIETATQEPKAIAPPPARRGGKKRR